MAEELPDLPEYSAITRRAVPQMPSGMEKEEECVSKEHLAPHSSMFSTSAILPTGARFHKQPVDGDLAIIPYHGKLLIFLFSS